MVTTGSLVNIYHHAWLTTIVCDENVKIHSLGIFQFKYTTQYMLFSCYAEHLTPRTYFFCHWTFVPETTFTHFSHLSPSASASNHLTSLFPVSMNPVVFWLVFQIPQKSEIKQHLSFSDISLSIMHSGSLHVTKMARFLLLLLSHCKACGILLPDQDQTHPLQWEHGVLTTDHHRCLQHFFMLWLNTIPLYISVFLSIYPSVDTVISMSWLL